MTEAGATERIRLGVTDPDDDPVTLSAGVSMMGVRPTVSGRLVSYSAAESQHGSDSFTVTASDGRGGVSTCEVSVLVQDGALDRESVPASEPGGSATGPIHDAPPAPSAPSSSPPAGNRSASGTTPAATVTTQPRSAAAAVPDPASVPDGSARPGTTASSSSEQDAATFRDGSTGAVPLPSTPGPGAGLSETQDGSARLGAGEAQTHGSNRELLHTSGAVAGSHTGTGTVPEATAVSRPSVVEATAEGTRTAALSHATERSGTAATAGASAAVGAVLLVLIGLVAMVLPRGRHRH